VERETESLQRDFHETGPQFNMSTYAAWERRVSVSTVQSESTHPQRVTMRVVSRENYQDLSKVAPEIAYDMFSKIDVKPCRHALKPRWLTAERAELDALIALINRKVWLHVKRSTVLAACVSCWLLLPITICSWITLTSAKLFAKATSRDGHNLVVRNLCISVHSERTFALATCCSP
jgi:hypothetical protein